MNHGPVNDINIETALAFLRALRPHGPWVLTAIEPDGAGNTVTKTFDASDDVAGFIGHGNREGWGIYYTGNLCGKPSKKPDKAAMTGAIMLHTDDDPRDGETPEVAKARIIAAYQAHDPPPSIVVDSGNGLQGIWLLEQDCLFPKLTRARPIEPSKPAKNADQTKITAYKEQLKAYGEKRKAYDEEVEARVAEIEDRNRGLALALGTTPGTHNVDRLLRLPGLTNWPNEAKRAKGRVPCQSSIIVMNDARYALDQFPKAPAEKGKTSKGGNIDLTCEDIEPDDKRLGKLDRKWIDLGYEGEGIENYASRSEAVSAFVCACLRAGIADDAIASCLMHWEVGEHVREQANVERALRRTLERARQCVEDSELFKMNEMHAVLPVGGKTRVATWGEDPEFPGRKSIVRFASFDDFAALYNKYTFEFDGTDKKGKPAKVVVPLGTWWIGNSNRRQYDGGMRFMPQYDVDVVGDTLNLWQGFSVPARKPEGKSGAAGCNLFLDHGLKIICSGDEEHFDYLMKREALIAQKRIRSEIAVALRTEAEGSGKGFWCRTLNHLYGGHALQVLNSEHVTGKHNAHLETLLRLTADEALFALNPHHRNALYSLITEPDLTIEPKFIGAYSAPNHLNIDIISNQEHYVPVSGTARRFFIPSVSEDRVRDHAYFQAITAQLNDGGFEALLYHLLHEIDVSDFNVRDVPKTAALAEQAAYSRKGVDLLVEKACNEGQVPCSHSAWPALSDCSGDGGDRGRMYTDYRNGFDYFIDHHSDRGLAWMGSLAVKRRLAKDWGCLTGDATRKMVEGRKMFGVLWPPLVELRVMFEAKFGPQTWACPDVLEWTSERDESRAAQKVASDKRKAKEEAEYAQRRAKWEAEEAELKAQIKAAKLAARANKKAKAADQGRMAAKRKMVRTIHKAAEHAKTEPKRQRKPFYA